MLSSMNLSEMCYKYVTRNYFFKLDCYISFICFIVILLQENMSVLSGLDAALHELGMLSAVTESRQDYLREQKQRYCIPNRPALNVLHMNTRYVTSVAVGRRNSSTVRHKPYPMPCWGREERTRTKSENYDVDLESYCGVAFSTVPTQLLEVNSLHKSRSMESVKINVSDDERASPPMQEVESVSSKIEQLQVKE
jgi:hypothetical protein